jgi:hypothetical protein
MKMLQQWKHETTMRLGASVKVTAAKGSKRRGQEYHRRIYRDLGKLILQEPGVELLVEPWFRNLKVAMMRSPDAVIHIPEANVGIVVEVKLNWKDGRDIKLIDEYLPIVKNALRLDETWPLLITRCLRGYPHPPLLGLRKWEDCMTWQPGDPTPVMLVP